MVTNRDRDTGTDIDTDRDTDRESDIDRDRKIKTQWDLLEPIGTHWVPMEIEIKIEVFPETLPPERGETGSGKNGIMGARPVGEALSGV